jgi:PAS domain S-box-containing protein
MYNFTIYNRVKSYSKDARFCLLGFLFISLSVFWAVRFFPSYFYKVFPPNIYLILHGMAEIFSIIISLVIFILAWATYRQTQNNHSLFIGVSFLGVAILDAFHLFSFPGMPGVFTQASTQKGIYFWLAARFWVVGALLTGSFLPTRNSFRFLSRHLLLVLTLTMTALVVGIDFWGESYVPVFFVTGEGLTPLKIALEWVIMALALVALFVYGQQYAQKQERALPYLMAGLILTIISEMCFTFYTSAADTYNLVGHIYKFMAYGFFFYALFVAEIRQPYLALETARHNWQSTFESISDGVWLLDSKGYILLSNGATERILGMKTEVNPHQLCHHILHGTSDFSEDCPYKRMKLTGRREVEEFQDGERKLWFQVAVDPIRDKSGAIVGAVHIVHDITQRKQAEEQLRKLSCAVEQSPSVKMITDNKGNIEYVNPKFTEITGYTFEEVRGQNPRILKSGHTPPEEHKRLWAAITGGSEWQGEFRNKKKNGELYWESASISPIKDNKGIITHFVKVAEDTTQRKLLEEQLQQSQKIEAIGTLAGGVAHDFNNLLTAIIANLELARLKAKNGPLVEQHLDEIENIAGRAAQLTRQLLAFSRRQILQPLALNLNDTITNMSKMLSRLIGGHIALELELESKLGTVRADPHQLEQVIMNLCVNARDAMPAGGKLMIETANTRLDAEYIEGHPWIKSGDYVMFTVTDTGCGMDEALRARIFEPFFTTKEVGKGTGLGLSMVYGIIKQHLGYINVYSEPGHGTTFKIYLPLSEEEAAAKAVREKPKEEMAGGNETLLLAEDEDSLRETIRQILEMYGYKVLTAKDGQEAVEIYEREKDHIDLAILDAVMPKMGGRQVAERIYRHNPSQKILFSSGYSASGIHESFLIPGEMHFIQKPYRAQDLAQKVREMLEA